MDNVVKPIHEFILWNNCNNHCKFCWQKHLDNKERFLSDKEKIYSIKKIYKEIVKISNSEHVLLVGGELFDEILTYDFYHLCSKIIIKQLKNEIGYFYVNTNLIYKSKVGNNTFFQIKKLINMLDEFDLYDRFKFTTSYDIVGRFKSKEYEELMLNNLKLIKKYFPRLNIMVNTILTKQACEAILNNSFNIREFIDTYNVRINLIPYVILDNDMATDKETTFKTLKYVDTIVPGYLKSYKENMLLNQPRIIYEYRAGDTNDLVENSCEINKCGHSINFTKCFKDSSECFACEIAKLE